MKPAVVSPFPASQTTCRTTGGFVRLLRNLPRLCRQFRTIRFLKRIALPAQGSATAKGRRLSKGHPPRMTCEFISCGWNDCIPWTLNKTERYNQFKLERTLALPRLPPLCILTLSIFVTTGQSATAQLARSYLNAPQGNLAMYSYTGTRSNTGGVKNLPIPETETRLQTQSLVYSRIMDIGGRTGGLGVTLPFTDLLSYDTQANAVTSRDAGIGDPSFTFEMNLFGAPALQREEFKDWTPGDYCGLHFLFGVPWGDYDPNSAVNLGANRFSFRPLLNYSLTPDGGRSWLDFYGRVFLFTDNDEYLGRGVLSQRPLANLELHCS